jgi:hypothetical protein
MDGMGGNTWNREYGCTGRNWMEGTGGTESMAEGIGI